MPVLGSLAEGLKTYQQKVVVLRLGPQVLKDDLLHEALHQVPVFHDAVADRPLFAEMEETRIETRDATQRNDSCAVHRFDLTKKSSV